MKVVNSWLSSSRGTWWLYFVLRVFLFLVYAFTPDCLCSMLCNNLCAWERCFYLCSCDLTDETSTTISMHLFSQSLQESIRAGYCDPIPLCVCVCVCVCVEECWPIDSCSIKGLANAPFFYMLSLHIQVYIYIYIYTCTYMYIETFMYVCMYTTHKHWVYRLLEPKKYLCIWGRIPLISNYVASKLCHLYDVSNFKGESKK